MFYLQAIYNEDKTLLKNEQNLAAKFPHLPINSRKEKPQK
jgi:hypothetical protein